MVASRGNVLPSRLQKETRRPGQGKDEAATAIGQAAHIVAHCEGGPRGGSSDLRPGELDRYPNLILLCANHHAEVDAQPETYTVDALRSWKDETRSLCRVLTSDIRRRLPWTASSRRKAAPSTHHSWTTPSAPPTTRRAPSSSLRNNPDIDGWEAAAAREWRDASLAIAETPTGRRRFAVFSLGRIPLAVQLGYVLGDRVRAELFHYDRDRASWSWDAAAQPSGKVSWTLRDGDQGPPGEAAVRAR